MARTSIESTAQRRLSGGSTAEPTGLTQPERQLWRSFVLGNPLRLGQGRPQLNGHGQPPRNRIIRAEVIRRLLVGEATPRAGVVPRLRLSGAYIEGELNLRTAELVASLQVVDSVFASWVSMFSARASIIQFDRCVIPLFSAPNVHLSGDLALWEVEVLRGIDLADASVDGTLHLDDTIVGRPKVDPDHPFRILLDADDPAREQVTDHVEGFSVRAPRLTVGGSLVADHLEAYGRVDLSVARIRGDLRSPAGRSEWNLGLLCMRRVCASTAGCWRITRARTASTSRALEGLAR